MGGKVLAVINEIEALEGILQKAIVLCQEEGSLLEVLFVHEERYFELPDFFHLKGAPEKGTLDEVKLKKEIEERLEALGYKEDAAVLVKADDTVDRVLELTKDDTAATLVVLNDNAVTQKLAQQGNLKMVTIF